MNEKLGPGPVSGSAHNNFKEAVCINADKIYDSCKDKDCVEDLRVYFTRCGQAIVDKAINVKFRSAEIIWVYIDVEQVPFNKGFYTVDIKFFFKITLDAFIGVGKPHEVVGLATFDKKVILFGSEGSAKIFSSHFSPSAVDPQSLPKTNMPKATVETVEPIALSAKLIEPCEPCHCCQTDISSVPDFVGSAFEDDLIDDDNHKIVLVTLGIFSIVRIERDVQLLIPAYDFCIPEKECLESSDEDPCKIFRKIKFPTDEFFPLQIDDYPGALDAFNSRGKDKDCGCNK